MMALPTVVERCRLRSIALLERNLGPHGILAATPSRPAAARGYTAVFGRDAAICALGMAVSGSDALKEGAVTGLATLAAHQAPNGQIPKFVDAERDEADFWYLGCIDATLWWLAAIALLDRLDGGMKLRRRFSAQSRRAILWLQCQEHQRFRLLQQNEASDWADIMPRSGFVLYTNALWLLVKRLYRLPGAAETRANADRLFHPFGKPLDEYRRARLLTHYPLESARHRDLYLSFVNFAFFGDEGDAFGNVLAILCGVADDSQSRRIVAALARAGVDAPYPVRALCDPVAEDDFLWRAYMLRHRQNLPWQYHNGGVWPFVGGFWILALCALDEPDLARTALENVARANRLSNWRFSEWLHGQTMRPRGMRGQSWNAASFLLACRAVTGQRSVFDAPPC